MSRSYATPARVGLTLAVFLGTLVVVAWRQSRAFSVMDEIERVEKLIAMERSEGEELRQRIQYLESLERVVADARSRLGMHIPTDAERVMLGEWVR